MNCFPCEVLLLIYQIHRRILNPLKRTEMSVLSNSKESMNNKNKCCFKENCALVVWLSVIYLSDTAAILPCSYINKQRKSS